MVSCGDHPFFAGIYTRLSVDSHNHKNESIETQIAIGEEYIRQYNEKVQINENRLLNENMQFSENMQLNKNMQFSENMQFNENMQFSENMQLNKNRQLNENRQLRNKIPDKDSSQYKTGTQDIVRQQKIILYQCYRDLGKSGTTFNREGFRQLMADIRSGKINCVIVKDFSRLGRNYIETGNYIERIFPLLGVRFISVTDGYDSLQSIGEPEQMGMQLKNLVNEMYARDISYRVKTAKKVKKEQGGYTGGTPPFGYVIMHAGGKRVLAPDPETAPILREIFELYHREHNAGSIIRGLYDRKIHRPKDARKYAHVICQPGEILQEWDYAGIKFILQNELYTGGDGRLPVIEPLVDEEIFADIQEHFRENARRFSPISASYRQLSLPNSKEKDQNTALDRKAHMEPLKQSDAKTLNRDHSSANRLLVCGECGTVMERVSNRKGGTYHCHNGGRIDQLACQHKYVSVQELDHMLEILGRLEWRLSGMQALDTDTCRRQAIEGQHKKCLREIAKIEKREYRSIQNMTLQYEKYRAGELCKEEFIRCRADQEKEKIALHVEKETWQQKMRKWIKMCENMDIAINGNKCHNEEREIVNFVTQIKLFPGKRMEISFDYSRKTDNKCTIV